MPSFSASKACVPPAQAIASSFVMHELLAGQCPDVNKRANAEIDTQGEWWRTPSDMSTIGSRVRALRLKRGLKQAALAAMAGITQGSLSLIENDHTAIPAGETLAGLCKALKTTQDFLIAGAGDPDSIEAAMDEHELVFLWRSLPPAGRRIVLDAAKSARSALREPEPK